MIKIFKLLTFILIVVACNQSKKESEKSHSETRWEKENKLDSLNHNEAIKLSKNNNAIIGWDTVDHFTYYLQELFNQKTRPISFIGKINDITKKDSFYILKISSSNSSNYKTYDAEISVNTSMFDKLKTQLEPKEFTEGCFNFQVNNITSNNPILKSETESPTDNAEDVESYLTSDFEETLIKFHGKLIDYYLYPQPKDDEN